MGTDSVDILRKQVISKRIALRWTRTEMAAALDVSPNSYIRWETESFEYPADVVKAWLPKMDNLAPKDRPFSRMLMVKRRNSGAAVAEARRQTQARMTALMVVYDDTALARLFDVSSNTINRWRCGEVVPKRGGRQAMWDKADDLIEKHDLQSMFQTCLDIATKDSLDLAKAGVDEDEDDAVTESELAEAIEAEAKVDPVTDETGRIAQELEFTDYSVVIPVLHGKPQAGKSLTLIGGTAVEVVWRPV